VNLELVADLIKLEREAEDLRNWQVRQDIELRWREEHDRLLTAAKEANGRNDRDAELMYVEKLYVVDTRVATDREDAERMNAERESNIKLDEEKLKALALLDKAAKDTHDQKQDALAKDLQSGGLSDKEYHEKEAVLRKAWEEKSSDIASRDRRIEANIEQNRQQDLSLAAQLARERQEQDRDEKDRQGRQ
jgi:hypothetical protein